MLLNHGDFEKEAADILPRGAHGYFAGGALDERTMAENRAALDRRKLRWKVLAGVSAPNMAVDLLGIRLDFPVMLAPVAFLRMAHAGGEIAAAKAAAKARSLMVLSTTSNHPVDSVGRAAGGSFWFQLYMMKDRAVSADLVRYAEIAGAKAIVLTVDVPAWGLRERDMRNGFTLPEHLIVESLVLPGREDFYDGRSRSDLASFIISRFDLGLTWDDLEWLRATTSLPIVVKGIGRADDARQAVEAGAAAVWVSNHGGRQLDSAVAIADALPAVADAIQGRVPIIADGGIRRGTDVLKLIGLGATATAIGRTALWALAAQGESGVSFVLQRLKNELANAMCLCGCADLSGAADALAS